METNNKYYTPTLEEFHIGFQYEWLNEQGEWIKEDTPTEISEDGYNEQAYGLRVKYLDKEDIESFGFTVQSNSETIFADNEYEIQYINNTVQIDRYYLSSETLFKGVIKNKSELKFILTRLGIIP